MALFAHLCEGFAEVYPNTALFRHYFFPRSQKEGSISSCVAWIPRSQEFFDNLSKKSVHAEPLLIQDTSQVELDDIAARAAEAELAKEAGSANHVEDEAKAAAEEKELAGWEEFAGEASSTDTGGPLIEDVVDESTEEEAEADDPPNPSPADPEDVDTVIEEVARDAAAEANKIAAEEAAKTAAEEDAKGSAEEAGKAATNETGKKLQALHRARLDKAKSRMAVVDKAEVVLKERVAETQTDIEKAQELAREQVAKDEATRHQHQAELNSQEEDLAAREEMLATTLRGKDEELSKANDSIKDLKLKLEGLEEMLSGVRAREETLTKDL
nr:tol-Pal system protein TolA-like [Aegilops tauschii subsp. strangulata]